MFITSAFTGITIEPVIRNRKPAVSGIRISSASGMCAAIELFWSDQAFSARRVAGEIDGEELERLGLELVRERLAAAAIR